MEEKAEFYTAEEAVKVLRLHPYTVGRLCLCNGLVSTMGLAQHRKNGDQELPIVTAGDDLKYILRYLSPGQLSYKAIDVLRILLGQAFSKFTTQ